MEKTLRVLMVVAALVFSGVTLSSFVATAVKAGSDCWVTVAPNQGCPPPPKIQGKVTSSERFKRECRWLPFPVGVKKPVVFFTRESDSRCIGKNWRRSCPECQEWIHPDRPRGPVNGPAKRAVLAVRLHDNMHGISVPRDDFDRIKAETAWCDYGRTPAHDSHGFSERPW